jgi:membrane-associated phospholipid phosphatase
VPQSRSALAIDLALAAVAVVAFSLLAYSVTHGTSHDLDIAIREFIHARANVPLTRVMEFTTNFGGAWFLWPAGIAIAGVLVREGRRREALLFAIAVAGSEALNETLKEIFRRQRPEAYFGYPLPPTYSFPSGHSFVSYCFYLALAEILARPEWPPARRMALWAGAGLFILWIGLSRIYLGVHYPTDVIGGYTAAVAWTAMLRAVHQGPPQETAPSERASRL